MNGSSRSRARFLYIIGNSRSSISCSSASVLTSQESRLLQKVQPVTLPDFVGRGRYCSQSSLCRQTRHGLVWPLSMSFSMFRRSSIISGVPVLTTIPSAAGVVHEVGKPRAPSISTTHILQAPFGSRSGWAQRVGISIPALRAASSTVSPSSPSTFLPSIVRSTMEGILS
ncbi:hypothetical protein ES703_77236 [subsurface metagenome]